MEKANKNGMVEITGDVIEYMVNNLQWRAVYMENDFEETTIIFSKDDYDDGEIYRSYVFNAYQLMNELEKYDYKGTVFGQLSFRPKGHELLY